MGQDVVSHVDETPNYSWRSPDLGTAREVTLRQGRVRYFDRGEGPVFVFVHGWLANANLWRKVVPLLKGFRCITIDMPLGSHGTPLSADADLTPNGCGELIANFLAAVDLTDVTLVGNDSGGAYSQICTAAHPERIARLVLNSCETPYDAFPPPAFEAMKVAAANDNLILALEPLRKRERRAKRWAYGHLIKHGVEDRVSDSYVLPSLERPDVRRDATKAFGSASESYVQVAGEKLIASFTKPVLFVWSDEDQYFPLSSVKRYSAELKNARVEMLKDAYSFTPEDQPDKLASVLGDFARAAS